MRLGLLPLIFVLIASFHVMAEEEIPAQPSPGSPREFRVEGNRTTEPVNTPHSQDSSPAGHQGGGSHSQQAVAAAQLAGRMAKMLAVKGFLDYVQNRQMQRALDDLGKKIEVMRNDVKMGAMTPAEYAAAQAAVNSVYERSAKANLPAEKEIDKSLLKDVGRESLSFKNLESKDSAASQDQSLLKKPSLMNDLAQLDGSKSSAGARSLESDSINDKANPLTPTGKEIGMGGQSLGMSPLGAAPGLGALPINEIHLHAEGAADSEVLGKAASKHVARSSGGYTSDETDSDPWVGAEGELNAHSIEYVRNEDFGGYAQRSSASLMTDSAEKYGSVTGWKKFLKPIKVQKNPFSRKLHSDEGMHPLFLLLLLVVAYVGGKTLRFKRRSPVLIPEVILNPELENHRRSKSKALVPLKRV